MFYDRLLRIGLSTDFTLIGGTWLFSWIFWKYWKTRFNNLINLDSNYSLFIIIPSDIIHFSKYILFQVSTPSDETPAPTSTEVEAEIENTPNGTSATESQAENETSTSQLKDTTVEKDTTEKSDEVNKNVDVENKSQK